MENVVMNRNSHPAVVKICSAINLLHIVIITIPNKVDGLACRGQFSLAWVPSYIDILKIVQTYQEPHNDSSHGIPC